MKKFSPMALIQRYKFLIIGVAVLSGIVAYLLFNQQQSYTAAALIEYTNAQAEEGLAPDGTEIDTSEIYSTEVMKEVFERMDLSYDNYNLDEFRSKIRVEPVMTSEEEAVQEAVNEQGEEVETKPTRYMVYVTLSHRDAEDPWSFARQLLDNMLDVFLEKYGENHVTSGAFVNRVSELNTAEYDYLEIIETIDSAVRTTYETLGEYVEGNVSFVSAANGYSFNDLYQEFNLLRSDEIPEVYAYILNNTLTKDKDVLLSKYQNGIEGYNISNETWQAQIDDIKEIIESYVTMMRESGNTDITSDYILQNIYDDYYAQNGVDEENSEEYTNWISGDETVQYDTLLENYVSDRSNYEYALIDIAYCEYIIDLYNGTLGEEESTEENSDSSDEILSDVDQTVIYEDDATAEEKQETVTTLLDNLVEKLNTIYNDLIVLNEEYNQYAGAQNISLRSDIAVSANVQTVLYTLIVVVGMAILATLGVIVAGRTGDIINYYIYMDRKLMLPNRTACDRYLNKYEKSMLGNAFVCISIVLTEVKEKNSRYGREECDEMIKSFARFLEEVFPGEEQNSLVAVNGLGQFILFLNETTKEQAEAYMSYLREMADKYNKTAKCKIEYKYGIAESVSDNIFRIRALMICAINKANRSEPGMEKGTENRNGDSHDQEQNGQEDKIVNLLNRLENIKKHG